MKRSATVHHRGVMAIALFALAVPAMAHANARVGPPPGDILAAWVKARLADTPAHDHLVDDHGMTGDMVSTASGSIYTALRSHPYAFRGTVWTSAFSALAVQGTALTHAEATEALAWDLGMTNGYPGINDALHPASELGARWAGTQLAKAGVTAEIARKALNLAGQGAYAVAANYAVAVQILVEKLACFEPSQWASLGLRQDVLQRFMLAETTADLRDYDMVYLMRLLQGELSTWHAGSMTTSGRRELPTALRVARVAAAYRDMQGYTNDPCTDTGAARVVAGAAQPASGDTLLCLVAANDRAVLRWYLDMLDRQTDPLRVNFVTATAQRLNKALRPVRPLWLGVLSKELRAFAVHVEVTESLAAEAMSSSIGDADPANRYSARRTLMLCEKELAQ